MIGRIRTKVQGNVLVNSIPMKDNDGVLLSISITRDYMTGLVLDADGNTLATLTGNGSLPELIKSIKTDLKENRNCSIAMF